MTLDDLLITGLIAFSSGIFGGIFAMEAQRRKPPAPVPSPAASQPQEPPWTVKYDGLRRSHRWTVIRRDTTPNKPRRVGDFDSFEDAVAALMADGMGDLARVGFLLCLPSEKKP